MSKQRYTQTKRSRNLSLPALTCLTETEAFELLKQIRFADTLGEPYCPHCYEKRRVYEMHRIRWRGYDRRWFCGVCRQPFSLVSGTVWSRNRKPLNKLLLMAGHFVTSANSEPSIQVARKCFSDPKTTYYAIMKIREALALEMSEQMLDGKVEVDGCHFGGHKRPLNDRALEAILKAEGKWQKPPKQALCAAVERGGRVYIEVHLREGLFVPAIAKHVMSGSKIYADAAGCWEELDKLMDGSKQKYRVRVVNHKKKYWTWEASTNHVEALFRGLRRMEDIHVHIAGDHLDLYGADGAFRFAYRRHSDAEKFLKVVSLCFRAPVSRRFTTNARRGRGDARRCARHSQRDRDRYPTPDRDDEATDCGSGS